MFRDILEKDWKVFKELRIAALERLCEKILIEARAQIDDPGKSSQEKFLAIYKLVNDRNDDIARGFDDFRRSTALMQIGIIHKMGLFTAKELARFSPEAQKIIALYAPIPET
jgi:hypothetical protein